MWRIMKKFRGYKYFLQSAEAIKDVDSDLNEIRQA